MNMRAQENLERQRFEVFNPRVLVPMPPVRGTARDPQLRVWLPGYIFIRLDLDEDTDWPRINNSLGVHRLLPYTMERPSPVRESAMKLLLDRCSGNLVNLEIADHALLVAGSRATVTEGIWAGHTGQVIRTQRERVLLLMSLFGRPTKVEVERRYVEAAI